jgi:hypothetical protein
MKKGLPVLSDAPARLPFAPSPAVRCFCCTPACRPQRRVISHNCLGASGNNEVTPCVSYILLMSSIVQSHKGGLSPFCLVIIIRFIALVSRHVLLRQGGRSCPVVDCHVICIIIVCPCSSRGCAAELRRKGCAARVEGLLLKLHAVLQISCPCMLKVSHCARGSVLLGATLRVIDLVSLPSLIPHAHVSFGALIVPVLSGLVCCLGDDGRRRLGQCLPVSQTCERSGPYFTRQCKD